MRRSARLLVPLVVLLCAALYIWREELILSAMEAVARKTMEAPLLTDLPDGLHILLCGAGNPLPDPKRSGPCAAVIAGETVLIVDTGSGAARNLARLGLPPDRVDAILLTHFHSDHIDGLGELLMQRWATRDQQEPTSVYGPEGVEDVVAGFNAAYARDVVVRAAHHGAGMMDPAAAGGNARAFPTPAPGELQPVAEFDGLTVTSFVVDHGPVKPAVGYRFDYRGRSLVISGDTRRSANLEAVNPAIDLLVHEAQNATMVNAIHAAAEQAGRPRLQKISRDILSYHTTPVEAARSAAATGAKHLLFTHVAPALPFSFMNGVFADGVDQVYDGDYTVGEDGTLVSLPAESDAVDVRMAGTLF